MGKGFIYYTTIIFIYVMHYKEVQLK